MVLPGNITFFDDDVNRLYLPDQYYLLSSFNIII